VQLSARFVVGAVSFFVATGFTVLANTFLTIMIAEINRKRGEGDLESYFDFTPAKMRRIFAEYRSLYPRGRLHILALGAFGVAVSGLISVALCLGAFG
jgi:hypothetical protein